MNKLIHLSIAVIMALGFYGCGGSDELEQYVADVEEENEEVEGYEIALSLGGEISTEEYALTRASTYYYNTISDDLCGIQVYKDGSSYAYGLFDDLSYLTTIYLQAESTYMFVVRLAKAGSSLKTNGNGYYYMPFSTTITTTTASGTAPTNGFVYSTSKYFPFLDTTTSYDEAEMFYGRLTDYTPSVGGTATISMINVSFGLSYEIAGLTDGSITLTVSNDTQTLISESGITESSTEEYMFTFMDAYSVWQYPDDYTEEVNIAVIWQREIGITQDLGSVSAQIKRNTMNVIRITLSDEDSDSAIGITTEEDTGMTEVTVDISA